MDGEARSHELSVLATTSGRAVKNLLQSGLKRSRSRTLPCAPRSRKCTALKGTGFLTTPKIEVPRLPIPPRSAAPRQPRRDLALLSCSPDQHRRRIRHAAHYDRTSLPKVLHIRCKRLERPSEAGVSVGSTDTLYGRRELSGDSPHIPRRQAPKTSARCRFGALENAQAII